MKLFNMASIWKLPVVFVCVNNAYGMSTSTERVNGGAQRRRPSLPLISMPGVIVTGILFGEVAAVACTPSHGHGAGEGPTLIDRKTYRHQRPFRRANATAIATEGRDRRLDVEPRPDRVSFES